MPHASVFITGGTGYMGQRLIPALVARGHEVRALTRAQSAHKVPRGAWAVVGDPFAVETYAAAIRPGDVVVHLIGTPHPSPAKARQFEAVDYRAAAACIAGARAARAGHVVYVSVAQPAPVMRAYLDVRARVEALLRDSALPHSVLRPWYVLGPGHRWPYALLPMYWVLGAIPSLRAGAQRLGLVTLPQMVAALAWAVESAGPQSRVLQVPDIRTVAKTTTA